MKSSYIHVCSKTEVIKIFIGFYQKTALFNVEIFKQGLKIVFCIKKR